MKLLKTIKDYWWMVTTYTPGQVRSLEAFEREFKTMDKVFWSDGEITLSGEVPEKNIMVVSPSVNLKQTTAYNLTIIG